VSTAEVKPIPFKGLARLHCRRLALCEAPW